MARGPLHFRQRDVTAAVKAVENAGKKVTKVELDKEGNITISVGVANSNTANKQPSLADKINAYEIEQARVR